MSVTVEFHAIGKGTCTFSGRQGEGVTVSFQGYDQIFLSQQSFLRMVKMHLPASPAPAPPRPVPANGQAHAEGSP